MSEVNVTFPRRSTRGGDVCGRLVVQEPTQSRQGHVTIIRDPQLQSVDLVSSESSVFVKLESVDLPTTSWVVMSVTINPRPSRALKIHAQSSFLEDLATDLFQLVASLALAAGRSRLDSGVKWNK